jgi:hypothetical protein
MVVGLTAAGRARREAVRLQAAGWLTRTCRCWRSPDGYGCQRTRCIGGVSSGARMATPATFRKVRRVWTAGSHRISRTSWPLRCGKARPRTAGSKSAVDLARVTDLIARSNATKRGSPRGGKRCGRGQKACGRAWGVDLFEDEAGHTLRSPKARTWAPRGQTPVIPVSGKGSGRISVAGLFCVHPRYQHDGTDASALPTSPPLLAFSCTRLGPNMSTVSLVLGAPEGQERSAAIRISRRWAVKAAGWVERLCPPGNSVMSVSSRWASARAQS